MVLSDFGARLRDKDCRLGGFTLVIRQVDSTNAFASRMARKGAPHGSVFVAERQTAGRGRWNRKWESNEGGLYLSVIVRPEDAGERDLAILPLLTAVAGAEALQRAFGVSIALHWPNDLFVLDRKIGGVLCESSFTGGGLDFAVVGIGINVNQQGEDFAPEVRSRAISLRDVLGEGQDPLAVAAELLKSFESWFDRRREPLVLERFRELAAGAEGSAVRVVSAEGEIFEAVTEGLAPDGALKVRLGDGAERVLYSGDVHLLDSR